MATIPTHFLFRVAYPCLYLPNIPLKKGDDLLNLPEAATLPPFARLAGGKSWATIKTAWNEKGFALELIVTGKDNPAQGDPNRPRSSDGITFWLDTRDVRDSHRGSRYCHQFSLIATGAGEDRDEPAIIQQKIHRALQDAPIKNSSDFLCRRHPHKNGYRLEAFLPATSLSGFDVEVNARLGFFYLAQDSELGQQSLSHGPEFPFAEDPTLWQMLELKK